MGQFKVIKALRAHAKAEEAKALTSFELLTTKAVGIGDHSTEDYFKNASEALDQLSKAVEQIEILDRYFPDDNPSKMLND
jgi:ABC-type amino acid transport substrate-binding protein